MLPLIDELFRAMEWSDSRMWSALREAPDDMSVREKVHHLHMVQYSFLSVWRGNPTRPPSLESFEDTLAMEPWVRSFYPEARAFLATLDESSLAREMRMPWAARVAQIEPAMTTLGETMLQVPLHSTHHRGQVMMRLRELGAKTPTVDFILWIWLGRPKPEWSSLSS